MYGSWIRLVLHIGLLWSELQPDQSGQRWVSPSQTCQLWFRIHGILVDCEMVRDNRVDYIWRGNEDRQALGQLPILDGSNSRTRGESVQHQSAGRANSSLQIKVERQVTRGDRDAEINTIHVNMNRGEKGMLMALRLGVKQSANYQYNSAGNMRLKASITRSK
jgi:hypothetical protein